MSESNQEGILDVREWSEGLFGCPGVVVSSSRMSGSGPKSLSEVRKWSEGPPGCPGVVRRTSRISLSGGRPFWMSGSCRDYPGIQEALPILWESSGDHPGCPGVVGRPSRMSGRGREGVPNVWEQFGGISDGRERYGDTP